MFRRCLIATVLVACGAPTGTNGPKAPLGGARFSYAAAAELGTQQVGEDAGMLYAFVQVEGPGRLTVEQVTIGHDGGICSEPKEAAQLARLGPIADPAKALTVEALKQGAPFAGQLAAGVNYLRLTAMMDHMCGGEANPTIELRLRLDGKPVQLVRALDQRLPS